jgi:hypothetical protein
MVWADWIPAITSSAVLAIAGSAAAFLYKVSVEKSIQHQFDQKLETLKAKLRSDEEELKSNLRAKDEQIAALRSGALAGMASRRIALDARRLTATERLWGAAVDLGRYKFGFKLAANIKMDVAIPAAAKQDQEGEKIRDFAEALWKSSGLENLQTTAASPDKERPFLSALAWAQFSALRSMITYPVMQLLAVKTGAGEKILKDEKPILDLVKSSLPHYSNLVDQYGIGAFPHLIEELESTLLAELARSLEGSASDDKSVFQAADILKAVERVSSLREQAVTVPEEISTRGR